MEIIAAGFCNHADAGTAVTAEGCIVEPCLYLELLDAIGVGNRDSATGRGTTLDIAHANSVHQEIIVVGTRSVHVNAIIGFGNLRQRGSTGSKLSSVVDSGYNPWRETCDLGKIPCNQW